MKLSDGKLVQTTLDGDKSAYGELYDRYARLIRVICHDTTGDFSQAEDLGQEVFIRAYQKLETLQDPEKFGGWLVSIGRNICREFRRGKFRDRHVLVGLEPPEAEIKSEKQGIDLVPELKEALKKLNEQERMALHIYYMEGQDVKKTQELLGVSRSGLYRLLEKAKKKVAKFIEAENQPMASENETQKH